MGEYYYNGKYYPTLTAALEAYKAKESTKAVDMSLYVGKNAAKDLREKAQKQTAKKAA
jgi:hypothetical protein